MYSISDPAVVAKIESYCRTWRIFLCDLDTGESYMGEAVMTADSDAQSTASTDDIELGAVCAAQWTMTDYNPGNREFLGTKLALYFYLKDFNAAPTTWGDLEQYTVKELSRYTVKQLKEINQIMGGVKIPMGEFTCIRSKKNGGSTDLTLCDALYFSDKLYTPSITLPAYASGIENDICTQLGLTNANSFEESKLLIDNTGRKLLTSDSLRLRVRGFDFIISSIANGTTMRKMLGYIASAMGQFGFVDRFGQYRRKWYTETVKNLDSNTLDLPELSEKPNTITRLICHAGETDFDVQAQDMQGRTIEFENPYMNKYLFDSLWRRQALTWYTADLNMRLGDPRLDLGDIVAYEGTYKIPITGLAFSFDGGLSAQICAVGRTVEEEIEV
ncbi:MAG: hypothetical protein IJ740_08235 [Ruminococcus sp.]|nr:hypothetical protein [Ruminococcus sp.]